MALTVFDDGGGPALYAGGNFTIAGGASALRVAKWDGSSWSSVGSGPGNGVNNHVLALTVFDDGSGPALWAGGEFGNAGGVAANFIAQWDGSSWSALESGMNSAVMALAVFDDGSGPALYAGGGFSASPAGDSSLAKWGCACTGEISTYCTPSTTTNGCVPSISGVGAPSASAVSGFDVTITGVEGQKTGLLFYGMSGPKAFAWGTGFNCVKSPVQRMPLQDSGGTNNLCDGVMALDFNAYMATHPSSLGGPFVPGQTFWMQGWFRDPPAPKGTNFSDALQFTTCP
jgi:hypothetical protein